MFNLKPQCLKTSSNILIKGSPQLLLPISLPCSFMKDVSPPQHHLGFPFKVVLSPVSPPSKGIIKLSFNILPSTASSIFCFNATSLTLPSSSSYHLLIFASLISTTILSLSS
uniref:Uncharacterized protein n=1 Tax=Cacopsylla melanoneura TaxID=428564 RepID=A0A8D8ZLU4_9HEMI